MSFGKRSITPYFDRELLSNKVPMQPNINISLNIESKDVLGHTWSKFFQANEIVGRKGNCSYFCAAMMITKNLVQLEKILMKIIWTRIMKKRESSGRFSNKIGRTVV
jgi:hypothetical protein